MLSDKTSKALSGISKATLHPGVRIKHLFRIMTHCPDLWMLAYSKIYSNRGAITPGVNENTLDGMSIERINRLIELLKSDEYQPQPARRAYVPKKNGKLRPLGMPSGDDKLIQEVARILLELIYEPVFTESSHGFRPERSCHTALTLISRTWKGLKWVVDMDIQGFFDNIDHEKMIEILEKKIDDEKFIRLIKKLLRAGYLEDWKFHDTYSGTPQGGICSPILANIFLHELDQFVEKLRQEIDRGDGRKLNLAYSEKRNKARWWGGKLKQFEDDGGCFPWFMNDLKDQVRELREEARTESKGDPMDEDFKRLKYIRYADDFAIGVTGSKADAEMISRRIREFLETELKLKIAEEKSGIHHAQEGFNYLGYRITANPNNERLKKAKCGVDNQGRDIHRTRRSLRSQVFLQVPQEKVWEFCRNKGYLRNGNEPIQRPDLLNLSDYEIVATFNAEMRGFANYYALAPKTNLYILEWAGVSSLFRTLGNKHKTKAGWLRSAMKQGDEHVLRYQVKGEERTLIVFKLKHRMAYTAEKVDSKPGLHTLRARTEILQRMNAGQCEYCGTNQGPFEVHHIRKLKDLKNKKNKQLWEVRMCARNRKTMVLCDGCHTTLHTGKLQGWKRDYYNTETESAVQ